MDEVERHRLNLLIAEHVMEELYWQAVSKDEHGVVAVGVPRLEKEIAIKNCELNKNSPHFGPLTPTKVVKYDYVRNTLLALSVLDKLLTKGFRWSLYADGTRYEVGLDHEGWPMMRTTVTDKMSLSEAICAHVAAALELDPEWPWGSNQGFHRRI